jgi:hypothetical protein
MSLISEALKKARQEVARQDADRLGSAPPSLPHPMPASHRERRERTWIPALVGGFVGAAVVTAVLLVLLRPAPELPGGAPAASPPARPAARPETAEPAEIARPTGAIPAATPRPATATPVHSAPTAGATVTIAEVTLPAVLGGVTAAAAPTGEPPPYRVRLDDGKELVLRGIAAGGEGAPVALVNRRAVGVGEIVDGWKVVRIEPKQVELVRGGETVMLSLRR